MKQLETKRLYLRDWTEDDIGCGVFDENTIRYLISAKNNYAVVLRESGLVIGTVGLNEDAEEDDPKKLRNLGFRLLESHRNQGLMTEALACVIENAYERTDELSYVCPTDHIVSRHIAEKFGFQYVKTYYAFQKTPKDKPTDFLYFRLKLVPR